MSADSVRRRQARLRGVAAEDAVEDYLVVHGYKILYRNLRIDRYELDIVAVRGELVVIVEVRNRGAGSWLSALESVSLVKRQRVRSGGRLLWAQRFEADASVSRVRFDVALVAFGRQGAVDIEYLSGAFWVRDRWLDARP